MNFISAGRLAWDLCLTKGLPLMSQNKLAAAILSSTTFASINIKSLSLERGDWGSFELRRPSWGSAILIGIVLCPTAAADKSWTLPSLATNWGHLYTSYNQLVRWSVFPSATFLDELCSFSMSHVTFWVNGQVIVSVWIKGPMDQWTNALWVLPFSNAHF